MQGFALFEGVLALGHRSTDNPLIAYLVLAAAGLAEGTSLVRVLVQFRGEARRSNTEMLDHVQDNLDTTVKATLFEDSAAMIGLVLAALGLVLRQVTGSSAWDGAASIAIGGLLVVVAIRLGLDSREFLIGRAAGPRELETIRAEIAASITAGLASLLEVGSVRVDAQISHDGISGSTTLMGIAGAI